jgi:hypothetical protein
VNIDESGQVAWASTETAPAQIVQPGISLRKLWSDGLAHAQVLDIAAGAIWQGVDVHEPGPEEIFVVSGVFNDGVRDYPAGSFVHNAAGSRHVPQSRTGCRLFLFYPQG